METLGKGSSVLIHLNHLKENYLQIKDRFPQCEILFMVKANAYGHGAVEVARYSYRELGIKEFGLASLSEAIEIRDHLPEMKAELYVFSDLELEFSESKETYLNKRILPVISNWEDLEIILNDGEFEHLPLCLKFNTGMNRLGFLHDEVEAVIERLKKAGKTEVHHLMSHFANGSLSMETNKRNQVQRERFMAIKETFIKAGLKLEKTSLGNSGAIEQGIGGDETHLRPGLMMFGPSSLAPLHKKEGWFKGRVVSELKAKVLKVFPVKKGDPLGYGSTPCGEDGVVAIFSLGYGDGITTQFRNAKFTHKGEVAKVCARVCMDMTYLLFPVGSKIQRGDEISLWDEDSDNFEALSESVNAIPYELVIQLTSRVPRIYQLD